MPDFISTSVVNLNQQWQLTTTAAGAIDTPQSLSATQYWIRAIVPGTVAQAMQSAGIWNINSPTSLHDADHWYRTSFVGTGKHVLRFNGLATLAEVWLNGEMILRSTNMFVAQNIDVELKRDNELCICFRSLDGLLKQPIKRARWRPAMIVPNTLEPCARRC